MAEPATPLVSEDLVRAMKLVQESDSVELKVTIAEEHRNSAVDALDIDPLRAQLRQIFFFDTPDLTLDQAGVVVRARRVQGKGDDSVIKLRPVVPSELPPEIRSSPDLVVEVDAMRDTYVCSAAYKRKLGATEVREVFGGRLPIRKLFSKAQRAFYAAHAPAGVELDDLSILGPINVMKLKFMPADLQHKIAVELWNYPDGSRILELSTRCEPGQGLRVGMETRDYLTARGVELTGDQHTKTRTALEYFSGLARG